MGNPCESLFFYWEMCRKSTLFYPNVDMQSLIETRTSRRRVSQLSPGCLDQCCWSLFVLKSTVSRHLAGKLMSKTMKSKTESIQIDPELLAAVLAFNSGTL